MVHEWTIERRPWQISGDDRLNFNEELTIAKLLVSNRRTQVVHSQDPLSTVIEIFGEKQLQALQSLHDSGVFNYESILPNLNVNELFADWFIFNLIMRSDTLQKTANELKKVINDYLSVDYSMQIEDPLLEENISKAQVQLIYDLKDFSRLLFNNYGASNLSAIVSHEDPISLKRLIGQIKTTVLLNNRHAHSNFQSMIEHKQLKAVTDAVIEWQSAGLFHKTYGQYYFSNLMVHEQPQLIARSARELNKAGLLHANNVKKLFMGLISLNHVNLRLLAESLPKLNEIAPLSDINNQNRTSTEIDKHHSSTKSKQMGHVLRVLYQSGILYSDNVLSHCQALINMREPFKYLPYKTAESLLILKANTDLLVDNHSRQACLQALKSHSYPKCLAKAIVELEKCSDLLEGDHAQTCLQIVYQHNEIQQLKDILANMGNTSLLKGEKALENLRMIAQNEKFVDEAIELLTMEDSSLLTGDDAQYYFDIIAQSEYPLKTAHGLRATYRFGVFEGQMGQNHLDKFINHNDPQSVGRAVENIGEAGLMNRGSRYRHFEQIINHNRALDLGDAFDEYYGDKDLVRCLPPQSMFDILAENDDPFAIKNAVKLMAKCRLLQGDKGKQNIDRIKTHNGHKLNQAVSVLYQADQLTQANLDALMHQQHSALTTIDFWSRVPEKLFNQQVFNELLQCSRQPDPKKAINQYLDHLVDNGFEHASRYLTADRNKLDGNIDNNQANNLAQHGLFRDNSTQQSANQAAYREKNDAHGPLNKRPDQKP